MILTDTCILIEYFKENPDVTKLIDETGIENIVLNSIIVMELISGARNKSELNSLKKRLNSFYVLEINQSVMDKANSLLEDYHLSHSLKIPDAVIAATASFHDVPLFTLNKKDFKFIPKIKFHK